MTAARPMVRLGNILRRSNETVEPIPNQEYQEITARLWGKGIIERGRVSGATISGRRFIAKAGQFIASRIDARNGAMGVVPDFLDGALVTNDFPLFYVDENRLAVSYLGWLSKTADFVDLCRRASEGTTNRVRLKEERFLSLEIPLPPLSEQRRIVARIEEIAAQIEEAHKLRQQATMDMEAIAASYWRHSLKKHSKLLRHIPFTTVTSLARRPVNVDVNNTYQEIGVYCFGRGIFHKPPRSGLDVGSKDLIQIHENDVILQLTFAWEGAVALAGPRDHGLFGSARYLTFTTDRTVCTPHYLITFLKLPETIEELGRISPGSAGRNRVLSVKRLAEINVPIIPLEYQAQLNQPLFELLGTLKQDCSNVLSELDLIMPRILDRAFKGEM